MAGCGIPIDLPSGLPRGAPGTRAPRGRRRSRRGLPLGRRVVGLPPDRRDATQLPACKISWGGQIKIRPSPGRQTSGRGENRRELPRCFRCLPAVFSGRPSGRPQSGERSPRSTRAPTKSSTSSPGPGAGEYSAHTTHRTRLDLSCALLRGGSLGTSVGNTSGPTRRSSGRARPPFIDQGSQAHDAATSIVRSGLNRP